MIQHLVSRVLLRRWASDKNGLICGLDLNTLTERVGLVDSFGAIKDLVTKDADEIERLWNNEVERKLTHPLDLLEQGLILDPKNTVHLECLKDCLSLHWARSYTLVHMLKGSQGRFVDQVAKGVLRKYTPAQAVKALTGFYVPGPSAYFVFRQKIDEEFTKSLHSTIIAEEFKKNFAIAREKLEAMGLEVGIATKSEFIIGDCPVATWDQETNRVGPLQGVGWNNADVMFMPLGPHHVIALSKTNRYRELNEGTVVGINKLQVQGAYREIYSRPGSGIPEQIASAILKNEGSTKK